MTEKTLTFEDDFISTLTRPGDDIFPLIQRKMNAKLHLRGNELTMSGEEDDVQKASNYFARLVAMHDQGASLDRTSLSFAHEKTDAKGKVIVSNGKLSVMPKTPGQVAYVETIANHPIAFGIGPAGTGKTFLAVACAVQALQAKKARKIILTRPVMEAGESLGFLPGTLEEKIDPYLRPLFDALGEMLGEEKLRHHLENGIIELSPLAYMRGRTLNGAWIILDEAQNTTPVQMKMFLTRMGNDSKMVITGDISQSDLRVGQKSGLQDAERLLSGLPKIGWHKFDRADIVRNELVQVIVDAYEADEATS